MLLKSNIILNLNIKGEIDINNYKFIYLYKIGLPFMYYKTTDIWLQRNKVKEAADFKFKVHPIFLINFKVRPFLDPTVNIY